MPFTVNIIGAGHLGKTIGYLLVKKQLVSIQSICNRSQQSTLQAIQFIGQGKYCPSIRELPAADITFITTPDDKIALTCEALSHNPSIKKASIIVHCSGSLTSDALETIKTKGCFTASVHPMRSFSDPQISIEGYDGTYCAMEGDNAAIPPLRLLFEAIGSITYQINKEGKALYHAAGVFSSNYVVTLVAQAFSCIREAGVQDEGMAMRIIFNILKGTILNLEQTVSPKHALTGPIQRGDVHTILKHIDALSTDEQKHLYAVLGQATLPLTTHSEEQKEAMVKALAFVRV